ITVIGMSLKRCASSSQSPRQAAPPHPPRTSVRFGGFHDKAPRCWYRYPYSSPPYAKLHCRANLHTARVPDSAALCWQPIYRFGWHIDLWDSGPQQKYGLALRLCSRVGNSGPVVGNAPQTATRNGAKFEDRTYACLVVMNEEFFTELSA